MKMLSRSHFFMLVCSTLVLGIGVTTFVTIASPFAPTELSIYNWEDYISPDLLAQFEEEYNVNITIHVIDSPLDAVRAYRENPNLDTYDLVFFNDNTGDDLLTAGVLSVLRRDRIPNIKHITRSHLNTRVNADGLRGVPYTFGTTGIVFNTKYIDPASVSWDSFFNGSFPKEASCLLNDETDIIGAAALALGYDPVPTQNTAMLETVSLIRAYTEQNGQYCDFYTLIDELVHERILVAQQWSGDALIAIEQNPALTYVIPPDRGRLWRDSMGIPIGARNVRNAERFINFINRPEIAAENVSHTYYASSNEAAQQYIDPDILVNEIIYPATTTIKRLISYTDFPYYNVVIAMRGEVYDIIQTGTLIK